MFYLIDKNDELVRKGESRMALRRVRRKSPEKDNLRIVEGAKLSAALKAEASVDKKSTKEKVSFSKKKVKKAVKNHVEKLSSTKKKKKKTKNVEGAVLSKNEKRAARRKAKKAAASDGPAKVGAKSKKKKSKPRAIYCAR